jgi:hypothetical protein
MKRSGTNNIDEQYKKESTDLPEVKHNDFVNSGCFSIIIGTDNKDLSMSSKLSIK